MTMPASNNLHHFSLQQIVQQTLICSISAHVCVLFLPIISSSSHLSLPQTLYTYPDNFRAYKVLIAAQYSGAALKVVSDPPYFELGKTNRSPDFLTKFPLGKVHK